MTFINSARGIKSAKTVLGLSATVTVDRTYRKNIKGSLFYINCGYTSLPDGKKDKAAFIIGTEEPLTQFTGEIIAIASTEHGKRDILVIAPSGSVYYEPHISNLLRNLMPRGNVKYVCYYEKSCGAVLFTVKEGKRYYILIKNMSGHIGFPKGHVEYGENEQETALREIYEETGVHAKLISGFRESYDYLINGFVKKEAVYFTAPFDEKDIKMQIREISEYKLVTYEEAIKLLNYTHDKNILRKAEVFISSINSKS